MTVLNSFYFITKQDFEVSLMHRFYNKSYVFVKVVHIQRLIMDLSMVGYLG